MAGFEDLIRDTLEKQGDLTKDRRSVVYASARKALEKMLAAKGPKLPSDTVTAQKQRLENAIAGIEKEYAARYAEPSGNPPKTPVPGEVENVQFPVSKETIADAQVAVPDTIPVLKPATQPISASVAAPVSTTVSAPVSAPVGSPVNSPIRPPEPQSKAPIPKVETGAGTPKIEPVVAPRQVQRTEEISATRRVQPTLDDTTVPLPARSTNPTPEVKNTTSSKTQPPDDQTNDYVDNILREKRPNTKLLLWTIILVGIGVGVWWGITFGPELLRAKLDGSVPNPETTIETGGFIPEDGDGWITVFSADANPEAINTDGKGAAELIRRGSRIVAQLASNQGTNNNILITMPRGVMDAIRGKAATFELALKSTQGEGQEFAVFCQFGDMGTCGRKRFTASSQPDTFIFDILVNNVPQVEGEEAFIAINTDLSGKGRAVDIFGLRVRAGR